MKFEKFVNKKMARKSNKQKAVVCGVIIATVTTAIVALLAFIGFMAIVAVGLAATYFWIKDTKRDEMVELERKRSQSRVERARSLNKKRW